MSNVSVQEEVIVNKTYTIQLTEDQALRLQALLYPSKLGFPLKNQLRAAGVAVRKDDANPYTVQHRDGTPVKSKGGLVVVRK